MVSGNFGCACIFLTKLVAHFTFMQALTTTFSNVFSEISFNEFAAKSVINGGNPVLGKQVHGGSWIKPCIKKFMALL